MGLRAQEHYVLEVRVVDVSINTEEPLEYYLDYIQKVFGERDPQGARENLLVVQLVLDPCHQEVYVFLGTDLQWCLNVVAICP